MIVGNNTVSKDNLAYHVSCALGFYSFLYPILRQADGYIESSL